MDDLARAIRRAWPTVLGRLLARTGDLAAAEDALGDAVLRALETWPERGAPDSAEAWLTRTAVNAHVDGLRRQSRAQRHALDLALTSRCAWSADLLGEHAWPDDTLRLLFTCCDPLLGLEERAALALATVAGLTTDEIARAFLLAPRTAEQRLTRARRRLRERRRVYTVPDPALAADRLDAALATVYFIFNAGYWSHHDHAPIRRDLTSLALTLARGLDAMLPHTAEIEGLLALLLFHEGRANARLDADGHPLTLELQDRARWHSPTLDEAAALLREALNRRQIGPFQIEAAIAAVHCAATHADDTDWLQIALLYASLEEHRPSPTIRVNRAFAVGKSVGAAEGLALLATVEDHPALAAWPYLHLVRGALLDDAGRHGEAIEALRTAERLATNAHEAAQIRARIAATEARATAALG